jgi:cytidine deaminase
MLRKNKPLSQDEIFKWLTDLRQHADTAYSHYHVTSIVEVKSNAEYFYASGVNIENDSHNRLSMHGEQAALANAITFLGGDAKFSRLWLMAAPADAVPDKDQQSGKSCGHCRQIMASLAAPGAEIYTVTLDGRISLPDTYENKFLPDEFKEQDLNLSSTQFSFNAEAFHVWEKLSAGKELTHDEIEKYLHMLSPHIIAKKFQTSPVTACIIKCHNGRYAAGVLMQDIAFLTTDAIFSAMSNAVTQFGKENLQFDEIHLLSTNTQPAQFTLAEIDMLGRHYAHAGTSVHVYARDGRADYVWGECVKACLEKVWA